MDPKRRYFHMTAIAGAILAVILFNSFREKPIKIPKNDKHLPLLERVVLGDKPEEVEQGCVACHDPQATPLSKDHPSNKKCLVCHPVPG